MISLLNPSAPRRLILWVFATIFLISPAVDAQTAPIVRLTAGEEARLRFTGVTSIWEQPDGSLVVVDRRERRLLSVTWDSAAEIEIGRVGDGPGEFRQPGRVYPMGPDSALFTDTHNGRWRLISGGKMMSLPATGRSGSQFLGADLSGATPDGGVLGVVGVHFSGPSTNPSSADSLGLVLFDRETGTVDTLAVIAGRGYVPMTLLPSRNGRPAAMIAGNPLAAEDEGLLFGDGWIAVARKAPYRVDWRSPSGTWTTGAPLPFEALPISEDYQCAALSRWIGSVRRCDPSLFSGWPDIVPPFVPARANWPETLMASPDGSVLIARTLAVDSNVRRYDLVGRDGSLVGVLELDATQRVVGIGAKNVYVVTQTEVDLQILSRHQWVFR